MRSNNRFFNIISLDEAINSKSDIFSFVRLFAALLVMYAHSYHIFGLGADPLSSKVGIYSGTLAVYIFFTISGFFIFQSAIKRTIYEYTIARVTRIFPALVIANIVTIFFIIPISSEVNFFSFVFSDSSWTYIKVNSLLDSLVFTLPDIFSNNPDHAINGSLWTLPVEVRAYIMAVIVVVIGITSTPGRYNACLFIVLIINSIHPGFVQSLLPIPGAVGLFYFFCIGGALYINRQYIPISPFLCVVIASVLFFYRAKINPQVMPFLIGYVVISAGYAFGMIRFLKLKHDYSYGFYLYAYPISQMSFSLFGQTGFFAYFSFICIATAAAAFFSWHCVEKPITQLTRAKIIPSIASVAVRFNMINLRERS